MIRKRMSSSSEDDDGVSQQAEQERAYFVLGIDEMLTSDSTELYIQAVQELEAMFMSDPLWRGSNKLRAMMLDDAMKAVIHCDWDSHTCRQSLKYMIQSLSRQRSAQKSRKSKIISAYRSGAILASRRKAKVGVCPDFPPEIFCIIFQSLDPISLAKCRIVCKEWDQIIRSNHQLWDEPCKLVLGKIPVDLSIKEGGEMDVFSFYVNLYPFLLIPYRTKRFCVRGFVRVISHKSWIRLKETSNNLGLGLQSALYPKKPMFLSASEVTLWINCPKQETLNSIAGQWRSKRDEIYAKHSCPTSMGKFWQ